MRFRNKFLSFCSFVSALLITAVSCGTKERAPVPTAPQILFHTPGPVTGITAAPEATRTPSPTPQRIPADTELVRIRDYIPDVLVDLKYATKENFTGQIIYDFTEPYARYGTVVKLAEAQKRFAAKGYRILIWDAYRPVSAQFRLWEICPDGNYVSNPNIGYSNHTRGCALDITLADAAGNLLEMPTGFDDFTALADRDYGDVNETAAANARMLETVMQACGFQGYSREWWHFNDTVRYEPETEFQP